MLDPLSAISPLDGRYRDKLAALSEIASEAALHRYRVGVEVAWFLHLADLDEVAELPRPDATTRKQLVAIADDFTVADAHRIKAIERTTNHDVKAVEYFVKERVARLPSVAPYLEFVHFGCTSEDINNVAYALMLRDARERLLLPAVNAVIEAVTARAHDYAAVAMLARTHGQAASPTSMGKEFANVAARMRRQRDSLATVAILAKFNGAVGNFNAHVAAYPRVDWPAVSRAFVESLGLTYNLHTTQIEPHDYIAEYCHALARFNQVLLDFDRDAWGYIAIGYFAQRKVEGETGSSTMPHKVNPIDFENSEGNIGLANALLNHLAEKLPVSRWQRDLSDSTVLRNIGSALGYCLIAYESASRGIAKLELNRPVIAQELAEAWEVLAEAVQTVMRKHHLSEPYEALKQATRGRQLDAASFATLLQSLPLPDEARATLAGMTPEGYVGLAGVLAERLQ